MNKWSSPNKMFALVFHYCILLRGIEDIKFDKKKKKKTLLDAINC